jgi:hypothetical protein
VSSFTAVLSTNANKGLDIVFVLPNTCGQATGEGRRSIQASFIDQTPGASAYYVLPGLNCTDAEALEITCNGHISVNDAIAHGIPVITSSSTDQTFSWMMRIKWTETVYALTATRSQVQYDRVTSNLFTVTLTATTVGTSSNSVTVRTTSAALYVAVSQTITTANVAAQSLAMTVIFTTRPIDPSIVVSADLIHLSSASANIHDIVITETTSGTPNPANEQSWTVVFIINGTGCHLTGTDHFVISATMEAAVDPLVNDRVEVFLPFNINAGGDWCTIVETTTTLTGTQYSFASDQLTTEADAADMFLIGDTMYIVSSWTSDDAITIASVVWTNIVIDYDGSLGPQVLTTADVTNVTCANLDPASVCYSLVMTNVICGPISFSGKVFTIETTVKVTYTTGAVRTVTSTAVTKKSTSNVRMFSPRTTTVVASSSSDAATLAIAAIPVLGFVVAHMGF